MISYELCKKLKDAGFKPIEHANRSPEPREYAQKLGGKDRLDIVYIPTLSELIEACGDDFYELRYELDKTWLAKANQVGAMAKGSTPEEAVAMLWLEINKK